MRKPVLFIHGGGEGAYEEDRKLAASLQDALGAAYEVRYPKMPDEDRPVYEAWKERIAKELDALDGEVILVGHSLGGSILLKYLSEEEVEKLVAGLFLVAALEDLDLGDRRFDKIFAVRVGLFHREPERARGIVERWLAPGGAVFVFFDPPSEPSTPQRPRPRPRRWS